MSYSEGYENMLHERDEDTKIKRSESYTEKWTKNPKTGIGVIYNASSVFIRKEPKKGSKIEKLLKEGDEVYVLRTSSDFYEITIPGQDKLGKVYVDKNYCKLEET